MGGCCCCSSRRADSNRMPVYIYCPRASEEHEPLSSFHAPASAISSGPVFLTNLETSSPDTYRAPPPPLPYDTCLAHPQSALQGFLTSGNKADPGLQSESQTLDEIISDDDGKGSPKNVEDKPSKNSDFINTIEEEDTCPICLEEYDMENPQIISKCEHHFHLSCILEWMERSDTCPICDKIMVIDHTFSE